MQKSEEGIAERGNGTSRSHQKTVRIRRILGLEDHLFLWLFDGVLETSHPYHTLFVFAGAKRAPHKSQRGLTFKALQRLLSSGTGEMLPTHSTPQSSPHPKKR